MPPPPAPAATADASVPQGAGVDIANTQKFPALPSTAGKHSRPASTSASAAASPHRAVQRQTAQSEDGSDDVLLQEAPHSTPSKTDDPMQQEDEELVPAPELAAPVLAPAEEPPATVRMFRDQTRGRLCHPNRTNLTTCILTLALQVKLCSYCHKKGEDHLGGAPLHKCKEEGCTLFWADSCIGKNSGPEGDSTRKRCLFHLCCDAHNDPTCDKCHEVPTTWKAQDKTDPASLPQHPRDPQYAQECREEREDRSKRIREGRPAGTQGSSSTDSDEFVRYLRLTCKENVVPFTHEECVTSTRVTLGNLGVELGVRLPFTITSEQGRTGPYDIIVRSKEVYEALLEAEEIDIFSTDEAEAVELTEVTFKVVELDSLGRELKKQRMRERQALTDTMIFTARAASEREEWVKRDKARTILLLMDLPRPLIGVATGAGDFGESKVLELIKEALEPLRREAKPESMQVRLQLDKHYNLTGGAQAFISWPMGTNAEQNMKKAAWSKYKYAWAPSKPELGVIKLRLLRPHLELIGAKPCCFLPKCIGRGKIPCAARVVAEERAGLRQRRDSFGGDRQDREEKQRERYSEAETSRDAAMQKATSLARPCPFYLQGRCWRTGPPEKRCPKRHPADQLPMCAEVAGVEGYTCPWNTGKIPRPCPYLGHDMSPDGPPG